MNDRDGSTLNRRAFDWIIDVPQQASLLCHHRRECGRISVQPDPGRVVNFSNGPIRRIPSH
jgi:hypothetical protein